MSEWVNINTEVKELIDQFLTQRKVSLKQKMMIHAKIFAFFTQPRQTGILPEVELQRHLTNEVKKFVTLHNCDIDGFRKLNRFLTAMFYKASKERNGFVVLRQRIIEIRRIRVEQQYELRKMLYLKNHRRSSTNHKLMKKICNLPDVLQNLICNFI